MANRTVRLVAAIVAGLVTTASGMTSGASAASTSDVGTSAVTISLGTHNTLYGSATFQPFAGVIGWQEVNSVDARDKMRRQLGSDYAHYFPSENPAKSVPISWRVPRFSLINSGFQKTHGGEAGVTPNRYIVWVILEINQTGERFIVINTHFISGAWSGNPERQARWLRHYEILYDKVASFRRIHPDKEIFVVGDFNRQRAMAMPTPIRWVPVSGVNGVPIDHMYAPSNISHTDVTRLEKWGSDHFAYRMYATF